MGKYQHVSVVVVRKSALTDRIHLFELADIDEWDLPPFTAGSHVDVHLSSGAIRQYSLCSDPAVGNRYRLAVLREAAGRGGSREITDEVREGDELGLSLPRNLFPLEASATNTILIAGGIGITPIMSMIPVLSRHGQPFQLHFCTRNPASTPFLSELQPLAAAGRVVFHHDDGDPARGLDFCGLVARQEPGTHYYCCGPAGFLDAYLEATRHLPEAFVHYERFAAPPNVFQAAYRIRLERSRREIEVGQGESIADALERNGVKIMTGCRAGICGLCRVRYLAGDVVHRDHKLSPDERKRELTSCISGCASDELVLDL